MTSLKQLQIDYLHAARDWYKRDLEDSNGAWHAFFKRERNIAARRNLDLVLKNLRPRDFTKSDIRCTCKMDTPHFMLQAGFIKRCPLTLTIQWTRINLCYGLEIDVNFDELMEKAR